MKTQSLPRHPLIRIWTLFLCCAFRFFEGASLAVTVPPEIIAEQLSSAELVADIKIKSVQTITDSAFGLKTIASAEILQIHSLKTKAIVNVGEEIRIEFPGGENQDKGVMFSGLVRPYNGLSYKAHLNPIKDENTNVYKVAGFEDGFEPLTLVRKYSRNRTDGSDGAGTGPFLYWDHRSFPIPYYISAPSFKAHPDFVTAIEDSFKPWRTYDDVLVEFLSFGCSTSNQSENDNLNSIILVTENWPFESNAIAVTRNFYIPGSDANSGMILDSDILLNGQNYLFTTTGQSGRHDIQNIVTHEIGHFLGFGHEITPVDEDATMYAKATTGETKKRTLATNDITVLRLAYTGAGEKLDSQNMHCEIANDNVGCLAVHKDERSHKNYVALLLYLIFTLGLGRWIVRSQPS